MNQRVVQNGATAGDNAYGAGLHHNGKRLDTVELLANMGGESKTWNVRTIPLSWGFQDGDPVLPSWTPSLTRAGQTSGRAPGPHPSATGAGLVPVSFYPV